MVAKLILSWTSYLKMVDSLVEKCRYYQPDVVVGIARGGLIPAVIMSEQLDCKFASVDAKSYNGRERGGIRLSDSICSIDPLKKDDRILLVDDVADSGSTLKAVMESFFKDYSNVKVATVYKKPQSVFKPDFYVAETPDWIVFPYQTG